MAQTLSHPLAQHIQRLSKIRMAVPALRKGQYSTTGCSGSFAFKRRYTDATTDSYALVCISGGATFTGILNGTYTDVVTGDVKTVTNGTLTATCSGKGNLRVYVLSTSLTPAPGKIGVDGKYIYTSSPATIADPVWDGTQEELTDDNGQGGQSGTEEPETPATPCLETADEKVVFFQAPQEFGSTIYVYMWINGTENRLVGDWPGTRATALGGGMYKFVVPETATGDMSSWMIIWNNGSGVQTKDLTYTNHGLYSGANKDNISVTEVVSLLCEDLPETPTNTIEMDDSGLKVYAATGNIHIVSPTVQSIAVYAADGRLVRQIEVEVGENIISGLPNGFYIVGNQKVALY